jgi:ribosomal protein S18 acetylase RimI-like enzyme
MTVIVEIAEAEIEAAVALWERCGLTRPWNDPRADIALAMRSTDAEVLVGHADGALAATVMVGFDGHRGWVYYLAVAPDARRGGLGRRLMAAAEDWLSARGAPKIQLMVREENAAVAAFYEGLGYELQATKVFGKWLATGENDAPVNFVDSPI